MAQDNRHQCDPAVCGPTAPEPDRSAPLGVWSCWAMSRAIAAADTAASRSQRQAEQRGRRGVGATAPAPSVDLSALDSFYWPGGHLSR